MLLKRINIGTTQVMSFSAGSGDLILDGELVKKLDNLQYFGSIMARSDNDVSRRRGLAWSAFWKRQKLEVAYHFS